MTPLPPEPGGPAKVGDRAAATAHVAAMMKALDPERVALIEARRERKRERDRKHRRRCCKCPARTIRNGYIAGVSD